MLDWQNKNWIKVIAVILVVTFISYDIAWAVDFSPAPLVKNTPQFIPKILNFISNSIFKKADKSKKSEETEVSFRSQLIPSKKYEEDSGFQRLDTMKEMIKRQMEDMQRRQQIENERNRNTYNQYQINKSIYLQEEQKGQGVQDIQDQLNKARGAATNAAAAGGEFSYTLTKEGANEISLYWVGSTNLGNITINSGILTVAGNTTLGSTGAVIIIGWARGGEERHVPHGAPGGNHIQHHGNHGSLDRGGWCRRG